MTPPLGNRVEVAASQPSAIQFIRVFFVEPASPQASGNGYDFSNLSISAGKFR